MSFVTVVAGQIAAVRQAGALTIVHALRIDQDHGRERRRWHWQFGFRPVIAAVVAGHYSKVSAA